MSVTLSLRVTKDKRKPGVKPPSAREENIHHVVERLKLSSEDVVGGVEYLEELMTACDLKAQLEKLKEGPVFIRDDIVEKRNQEQFYFTVLVEILLSLELKSPLRSGIKRILRDSSSEDNVKVNVVAGSLTARLNLHTKSIPTILDVSNALCGCFDNFPLGMEGVRICQVEAYEYIVHSLTFTISVLSEEASPAENVELCQCIHTLVRAALHVCSQNPSADRSQLHQLACQLIRCTLLPLDTRTNCGLLVVSTNIHAWPQMLKRQLDQDDDDLTSSCLYSGIISCVSVAELSHQANNSDDKTALQQIFDSIMNIHHRNPVEPTMTLSIARTLVALSRLLISDSNDLPYMLHRLLQYTWEHLEHVMDSVKHLASTLLHNIAKMHSTEVNVHGAILGAMKSLPPWGRARHTALSTLLGKVPTSQLVRGGEDIHILYKHLSREVISSHTVNAFQDLLKHHYQEGGDKEEWKNLWIRPLLQYLDDHASVPLEQMLSKAISVCPDVVKYVLSIPDDQVNLGTILLCLCHAHKLGLLNRTEIENGKWKGLVDYQLLQKAVQHDNEQTRLSCLSLIVEAQKTSEPFTPEELMIITEYVSHNMNLEFPASRQRSIALLGKFVSRLNDSRQVLERKQAAQLLQQYTLCRERLELSCLDSLFPGASYGRRVTALNLLSAVGITPTPTADTTLLACLSDSYEDVKVIAMKLLTTTPRLLDQILTADRVGSMIEKSMELAEGVKPPDCLSSAYVLATLSLLPCPKTTLFSIIGKSGLHEIGNLENVEHLTTYCYLLIVEQRLTQQLAVARESLLKAASSGPMYGLLFAIKLLLSQINLHECKSTFWKQLVHRLLELSFSCSKVVASVVNNDSPEGHFPMDFDFDPTVGCGEDEGPQGVTSQMVLLCAWRTVKEVSLLLGHLAEEATIATSSEDEGLLSDEDLLKIGDHLTTLLAETKHRGAFEQAYVGFCKLVSRLWRVSGPMKGLPRQWLEDTMKEICENNENLCATRRSAGIPFMIQALICTQLEVEGTSAIELWVTQLLDMAESTSVSPTTHTHALNILRALFRNTQLGEAVSVFVERAVIITITAFSATSWMERNSATLLLSALVTRIFGVPRSKSQDQLSWKNKMTGRIFFQRYPRLFEFFQQELRKASQSTSANLYPSLYPVLLILGRLYPSSLEGTDSNVQLTQYIPDILVCAGSNIYKTRTLAARAMVALMAPSHFDSVITQASKTKMPANLRHGLLQQVAYFLEHIDSSSDEMFKSKAEEWIQKLTDLFKQGLSPVEFEALFHVLSVFSEKYYSLVSEKQWTCLMCLSIDFLRNTQNCKGISFCLLRPRICELMLKVEVQLDLSTLDHLCCGMLKDDMYEVRLTVLEFLYCLQTKGESSGKFCKFLTIIDTSVYKHCKMWIFERPSLVTEVFVDTVLDMFFSDTKYKTHCEEKAQILLVLKGWKKAILRIIESFSFHHKIENLDFLLRCCRDSHDEIALNSVYCVTQFMNLKKGFPWREENVSAVCEMLVDLSLSENYEMFSEALYELITQLFDVLQSSTKSTNRLQVYKLYIVLSTSRQWQSAADRVIRTESHVEVSAALLLALSLGRLVQNEKDSFEVTGQVFDKGDINEAYEELILSQICGKKFHKLTCLHKDLLNKPLDPEVRQWLEFEVGIEGKYFSEILALAKLKVLDLDPNDPSQFLNYGYQSLRLNRFKLKYIC